eukprot:scaffold513_cov71-Phaeocystis_antarctica.AAC.4
MVRLACACALAFSGGKQCKTTAAPSRCCHSRCLPPGFAPARAKSTGFMTGHARAASTCGSMTSRSGAPLEPPATPTSLVKECIRSL